MGTGVHVAVALVGLYLEGRDRAPGTNMPVGDCNVSTLM